MAFLSGIEMFSGQFINLEMVGERTSVGTVATVAR